MKNTNLENPLFVYFYWLSFIGLVLVLTDAFSCLDLVRQYAFHWFDIALTYAFLVLIGMVEAFLIAALLMLFNNAAPRMFNVAPEKYIRAGILTLLVFAWGNIFLRVSKAQLDTFVQNISFGVAALGVLWFYWQNNAKINQWFDETTPRLRNVVLPSVSLSFLLSVFLLAEPLFPFSTPATVEKTTSDSPNVLLIFADALAASDMSLYGYRLPTTPYLDEETKNWLVFENAFSVSTNSVAEMPATLTGRYPYFDQFYRYGDAVRESDGWLFLPSVLKSQGYDTYWYGYLTTGFNHFFYGFDQPICEGREAGFYLSRTRFAFRATFQTAFFPLTPKILGLLGTKGLRISVDCDPVVDVKNIIDQRTASGDRDPFFIYMHYDGVNQYPFPAGDYLGHFLPVSEGLADAQSQEDLQHQNPYPPELQPEVDKLRLRYDEAVLNQDRELFLLIQRLKEKGLYDDTLIIISADHGFSFTNSYMRYATPLISYNEHHVPLLVKLPKQSAYGRREDAVSNVDIMPTILDVLGISSSKNYLNGFTLLNEGNPDRVIYVRRANYGFAPVSTDVAAIQFPYKATKRSNAGTLIMFNLYDDPNEQNDLFGKDIAPEQINSRLLSALEEFQALSKALYINANMTETR